MSKRDDESVLVKDILAYLKATGVFAWRCNTGLLMGAGGRPVRFGVPGMSDILGVTIDGRFLAIECKMPGRDATKKQMEFLEAVVDRGGVAMIAHSVDDVRDELEPDHD